MFHVKHRFLLVLLAFVSLIGAACGGAAGARGWAAPVVDDEVIYVSTGKGRLDAINARTGQPLWRFPNFWDLDDRADRLSGIYATPVLAQSGNGVIYLGDYNGYLYIFRPSDLSTDSADRPGAASLKLDGPVIGGLALESGADTLFVTSGETLLALKASELLRRRQGDDTDLEDYYRYQPFKTGGQIWGGPAVGGGKVYVSSIDGNLYAIDQATGTEAWRFTAGAALATAPVVSGSTVLVGGFDKQLHAVDAATGSLRWSYEAAGWVWSTPIIDGSRVYIADFDGEVHAIDMNSGNELWSAKVTDDPIRSAPALASGILVVADESGSLYGLDPSTQTKRWGPVEVRSKLTADLVANGSTVYIAPSGCVEPSEGAERVYYTSVNAQTGDLVSTSEVC
jgi:outer membrane protein assembly factor BamB